MTTLEQAQHHIYRYSDSFSACRNVIDMLGAVGFPVCWNGEGPLDYEDWLTLLGDQWTRFDNVREYLPVLRKLLGTYGPVRPMMTPEENAAYDALPETVTCYRGCDSSVLTGAFWSLDWEIANSFPFTNRYRVPSPVVVKARVKKNRILALKLDRGESGIITFSARKVKVEPANADVANVYHTRRTCG